MAKVRAMLAASKNMHSSASWYVPYSYCHRQKEDFENGCDLRWSVVYLWMQWFPCEIKSAFGQFFIDPFRLAVHTVLSLQLNGIFCLNPWSKVIVFLWKQADNGLTGCAAQNNWSSDDCPGPFLYSDQQLLCVYLYKWCFCIKWCKINIFWNGKGICCQFCNFNLPHTASVIWY